MIRRHSTCKVTLRAKGGENEADFVQYGQRIRCGILGSRSRAVCVCSTAACAVCPRCIIPMSSFALEPGLTDWTGVHQMPHPRKSRTPPGSFWPYPGGGPDWPCSWLACGESGSATDTSICLVLASRHARQRVIQSSQVVSTTR